MNWLVQNTRETIRPPRQLALAVPLCALLLAGCATTTYRAADLPVEFQTLKTPNAQTIDWSKLAADSVGNELVAAGDVIEVTIGATTDRRMWTTSKVRVGDDGVANVPLIGPVPLAGLELPAAEDAVRAAAIERGYYKDPQVTLIMSQKRMNRVTVVGAVRKPGVYEVPRGSSDLIAAVFAAGGLADDAGTTVEIRRPQRAFSPPNGFPPGQPGPPGRLAGHQFAPQAQPASTVRIDLAASATTGQSHEVYDGDLVMVTRTDKEPIRVIGLVKRPGEFKLRPNQDVYLLDALAQAGGRTTQFANRVLVVRRLPDRSEPVIIEASAWDAKHGGPSNLLLGPGDVVSVEETIFTVALAATKSVVRIGVNGRVPLF